MRGYYESLRLEIVAPGAREEVGFGGDRAPSDEDAENDRQDQRMR